MSRDSCSAVRTGLEPVTPCVTGMYSNQLNYRTILEVFSCLLLGSLPNCGAKIIPFFIPAKTGAKKMRLSRKKDFFSALVEAIDNDIFSNLAPNFLKR